MEKLFGLKYFNYPYSFPRSFPPPWKEKIDRWHQLDAYSFGLTDAFYQYKAKLETPDMMLLASPYASNDADHQFVLSRAKKPAKMVHTLPNVRSSPLIKLMDWSGPVLCLQKDPQTILTALLEGLELLDQSCQNLIVWSVVNCNLSIKVEEENNHRNFEVNIFSLSQLSQETHQHKIYPYIITQKGSDPSLEGLEDQLLIDWLLENQSKNGFEINQQVTLSKNSALNSDNNE